MSVSMHDNYREQIDYLENQYEEMNGYEFYREVFPNNENQGEWNTDFSKPNAIYLYTDEKDKDSERVLRRRIMLKDTWEDDYIEFVECNQTAFCSGLSYRKRANKLENAQHMNALIFDLDGVTGRNLEILFSRFDLDPEHITGRTLPRPTYIVASGSGIHLYYLFDEPVDLFPYIKFQLKSLKYDITFKLWDYKSTTQNKDIQYQGINQGFRMVGSMNDKYNTVVRAFKVGKKVSLEYMNQYVKEQSRVDITKRFRPSKISKDHAKELFPEWYEKVIVNGDKSRNKWTCHEGLYEWWKRQIDQIKGGHRYKFLMCMAIYAWKCGISKDMLKKDLYDIFEKVADIEHDNPLTEFDVKCALEAYDDHLHNFTINDVVKETNVQIQKNKRNGRTQEMHLKGARALQEIYNPDWRNKDGRPKGSGTKEQLVKEYIKNHPNASPTEIARELGISRPTVYKYKKDC